VFRFLTRLILPIASLYLVACSDLSRTVGRDRSSLTTNTYSSRFNSDRQKIEFLSKYLKFLSPIEATEFHIVYHDNSTGILPGPSDWNIEAVMKVSPSNLKRWTQELKLQQQPIDLAWGYALIAKDKQRWNLKSKPRIYTRYSVRIAVFEAEGVVFKSVSSGR
jgi:hypothetical protein